jgi:hypothetical protein
MWNELQNSRTCNAIRDTRHEHFTHAGRGDRIRHRTSRYAQHGQLLRYVVDMSWVLLACPAWWAY